MFHTSKIRENLVSENLATLLLTQKSNTMQTTMNKASSGRAMSKQVRPTTAGRRSLQTVAAIPDGAALGRKLRIAVIGGGPAGACAAETLAEGGVETFMFERKLDNCKVREGAEMTARGRG
jgi:geranylgeranyl reductase